MSKVKTVATYIRQMKKKYEGIDHYMITTAEGKKEMKILLGAFVTIMSHEEVIETLTDYWIYLDPNLTWEGKKVISKKEI